MKRLLVTFFVMSLSTIFFTESMEKTINFETKTYMEQVPTDIECIIGADIGGTNSGFGVFTISGDKLELLLSLHCKSKDIKYFTDIVKDLLKKLKHEYNISIKHATFACAGVVSQDRNLCINTNLDFFVDAQEIIKNTCIENVCIANDFEVIGFGVDSIDAKKLIQINQAKPKKTGNRLVFGAGTGLGKCIMHWNRKLHRYFSISTEGGHADFAPQSFIEYELTEFIKKSEELCYMRWEDVLSGRGISRLYRFFCHANNMPEQERLISNPGEILKNKDLDKNCLDAYNLFTKIYARCAKNFALDALATGGVYIAGGIAAKNVEIFTQHIFLEEFTKNLKHSNLLANIPIYVITDYNISLYGAAKFMILEQNVFLQPS
ncbi:glucokinase [Candidatus Dependentiae bacterium]